jgi:transposase-like protein
VIIVGTDLVDVERELLAGEIVCPDCSGGLRPWGSARRRVLRCLEAEVWRCPRRGRCVGCGRTHVLLTQDSLSRRRDEVGVIGAALVAKAGGVGHRRAAEKVGVPASTVRGWFRRFAANAEAVRVWFTVLAHGLDPVLGPIAPTGTKVGDAVEAIAVAARAGAVRLGSLLPWQFASRGSRGGLLSNTSCPWAPAG